MNTYTAQASPSSASAWLPGFNPEPLQPAAVLKASPEYWLANFAAICAEAIKPVDVVRPDAWAAENIVFTSPRDPIQGRLDLDRSPFLRDPINAWDLTGVSGTREVTFVAPEQIGKTLIAYSGALWAARFRPGTTLIYYSSDDKARLANATKLRPLINNVRELRAYLELPNAETIREYRLGPARIFFGGAGSRIASLTSQYNVADEIDDWIRKPGVDPLSDLRKRSRAFSPGLLIKICTPKGTEVQSRIWREFLKSSQGYWHLRCLHCGELTLRSCDIHNLKFELGEKLDKGVHAAPVPDSIRLVCPKCGHAHVESDKREMIRTGAYIHKYPERSLNLGFQVGLLASQFESASWLALATAQANAGRSGDEAAQLYFDNSVRGLPFRHRKLDSGCERALHIHQVAMPGPDVIRWRFLAADTQENCYFYVVRGMDLHLNTYLLDCGKLSSTDDLKAAILGEYAGGRLLAAIIDEGGHRQDEVRALADSLPRVYTYKGNTAIRCKWRVSDDYPKLILGHAEHWRVALLQKMYASAKTDNSYWYTTEVMTDDYIRQLSAWQRPSSGKTLDELADGDVSCYKKTDGAADHLFDSEKMCLMLADYAWCTAIRPALEKRVSGGR